MRKLKVELHTHTNYSYDSDLSFNKIIEKCKRKKIDALGVADHNEIDGALRLAQIAPFKVIIGQEVLTSEGEVIGFFIKKYIEPGMTMRETIAEIKRQGGVVYLPHPFDKVTRKTAVKNDLINAGLLSKLDVVEVHNGRTIYEADNQKAHTLAKKYKKLMGCGSDAHTIFEFGRNYQLMDDFSDSRSFLKSLRNASFKKSRVMPWVFLITKFVRFRKRKLPNRNFEIDKSVKCDLCGSTKYQVIYKKRGKGKDKYFISDDSYGIHHQMVKCVDCGLIYCHPRDNDGVVLTRYEKFIDELYEKERSARQENQNKILDRVVKLGVKKGKILDVGAATGSFVEVANKNAWDAIGVEPSLWAVKYARENYNLKMIRGTLATAGLKERSFDMITLIDVIEHVTSPKKLLTDVKKFLKDDGVAVIITPNKDSFISRIMGEKWWHIRPDHIYYFDFNSIKLLIESLGFEIVCKRSAGWNFSYDYWISRFKNNFRLIYELMFFLKKIPVLNFVTQRNYSINFGDSLELYIRKVK